MTALDVKFMGWLMILMDLIFMIGSLFCAAMVVYLLRTHMVLVSKDNLILKEKDSNTKVAPVSPKEKNKRDDDDEAAVKVSSEIREWNTVLQSNIHNAT